MSDKTIYTYMGALSPRMANANYATAGQLRPLFNDPFYRTIGIGTRIFLGGGQGFVAWQGTQFIPGHAADPGRPQGRGRNAGRHRRPQADDPHGWWAQYPGLRRHPSVGIGVPIPILNEEILKYTTVTDDEIFAGVVDIPKPIPNIKPDIVAEVSYGELRTGNVMINGRKVPTASLSSYPRAREIATTLKEWISGGKFELTNPVAKLPDAKAALNSGCSMSARLTAVGVDYGCHQQEDINQVPRHLVDRPIVTT